VFRALYALLIAFVGCAQPSSLGEQRAVPVPRVTVPTASFALDRIDQRTLPLDSTYSHHGTGRGVTVYVFDGGVSMDHAELVGRVRRGYTAYPDDPVVCNGHGTAVAGAVAGTTLGVAPAAHIVDVKIIQCEKLHGSVQGIVDAAHWVIADHAREGGPAVANWSFVVDTSHHINDIDKAAAELQAAGITVVVSAGNVNINACQVSPGNAPGVITVGSIGVGDRRERATAWGPCIDLYAPGDSVLLPSVNNALEPCTQLWTGTSLSAGFVSGAAALYLEAHPDATPDRVAAYLRFTATKNAVPDSLSATTRLLFVGA
jgi:subtilisin family serine protease